MKWLKAKYTHLLILLSLVVSIGLQVVWLQQLFLGQKKELKQEIEHLVSRTGQQNMVYSLSIMKNPGNLDQIRKIFLSTQWEQLRLAFDRMRTTGIPASLSISFDQDSTAVNMSFVLKKNPVRSHSRSHHTNDSMTDADFRENDRLALIEMKKKVKEHLQLLGISTPVYYRIYVYSSSKIFQYNTPKGFSPAFASGKYIYNIQSSYKYQLLLPAIDYLVWYRMRYYLASSVLMVLLTCAAFYFLMRSLRNQQLYAEAKADFTSNMTHEFKTPIATVSLALESIKKYRLANDPRTLQNYLDIGQHELHRLDLMVEKVLKISSGDDAVQPLNLELYDVQSGLQQVVTSMELQLQNNQASIQFEVSEEPCFVFGDKFHLTNIFYNLIDNAIKYADTSLVLKINCDCHIRHITIRFKDNGPGISKLYQKKIFERFYRIPVKSNTHDIKGSGLGLHYVKQMVEKHGGSIKLNSEPGTGSEFTITLPAAT